MPEEDSVPFDPQYPDRPWTVCFYSFRGGVGRTTLAVSTALNLIRRWWSPPSGAQGVFLLDFDIEAPGLDEFEMLAPPEPSQMGLVEYVRDYVESGSAPDLPQYVYPKGRTRQIEDHGEGASDTSPVGDAKGTLSELYVMRAGRRDQAYQKFLSQFQWGQFHQLYYGHIFFENLRAGVKKALGCQYMIVDSRAGFSGISGVCLGHLADAVVLVFRPNSAHVQGLVDVVSAIRTREQREKRFIPRLYVASKVSAVYEREIPRDIQDLVEELVCKCEGGAVEIDRPPKAWEDTDRWEPRLGYPTLHYIMQRERVKGQHLPDSFISVLSTGPPPTTVEVEYSFVAEWVHASLSAMRRHVCEEQAAKKAWRETLARLKAMPPEVFETRLREAPNWPEVRSVFEASSGAELLEWLEEFPLDKQLILLRLLRRET